MLRPIFILGLVLTLVTPCVVAQNSVIKVVTRESFWNGQVYVSTQYMTASAWRTESVMDDHHFATIVLHHGTIDQTFTLDLDERKYMATKLDSREANAGPARVPVKNTSGALDIWIEVTDTGERKEMFGHTARHVVTKERRVPGPGACSSARTAEIDGWYIDSSLLPEWRRPKPRLIVVGVSISRPDRLDCFDRIEVHRTGELDPPGFALKTTTTVSDFPAAQQGTSDTNPFWVTEVIEFSEMPLDPALFKVTKDFHKVNDVLLRSARRAK